MSDDPRVIVPAERPGEGNGVSAPGPASDLISHAAGVILRCMDDNPGLTAPGHWAGALWKAGMLVHPGTAETKPLTPAPPPVPVSDHADCDHDCAVIVSDEDYQRSEGVCAGCGVRMKNDAKTGWGPSLPFGDVPCGSRVGECCPPHKFTNEGAPDVCDTCGDSEHPPVSDEAEAWAEWSADTFEYDGTIAHQAFLAGFRAARQAGKDER